MTPMNAKLVSSIVICAGIAGLAVVAWQQADGARTAQLAREEIAAKETTVQSDLRRIERRLAVAAKERIASKVELDARLKQTVIASQSKAAPVTPARRSINILEIIRNEPDAEVFFLESRRSELAAKYGPLFRSLGLSAEAAAKFQENYIRLEEARMDLADVRRTKSSAEDRAVVDKLRAEAEAQYATEQRELLGDVGYGKLQDYEKSSWRSMVSAIAGVAAVEHVPISATQADALVQAVNDAGTHPIINGVPTGEGVDWEKACERGYLRNLPLRHIQSDAKGACYFGQHTILATCVQLDA